MICQHLKIVGYENVSLFHIRHDECILSLILAFVKVSFGEFNSFLIILFLYLLLVFLLKVLSIDFCF